MISVFKSESCLHQNEMIENRQGNQKVQIDLWSRVMCWLILISGKKGLLSPFQGEGQLSNVGSLSFHLQPSHQSEHGRDHSDHLTPSQYHLSSLHQVIRRVVKSKSDRSSFHAIIDPQQQSHFFILSIDANIHRFSFWLIDWLIDDDDKFTLVHFGKK